MRGASAIENLLNQTQSPPIRVLVVWEPILPTDWSRPSGMVQSRIPDTRVIQLEVPTKVRQSRLGHADIATTMGYTHVVMTDDRKAAAELERMIFGSVQAETEHKTWQVAQGNA